jgi:hypothetical protein
MQRVLLIACLILGVGCARVSPTDLWVSSKASEQPPQSYYILAFKDGRLANPGGNNGGTPVDIADAVRSSFRVALVKNGFGIIDSGTGADSIIKGTVTEFEKGTMFGGYTTVAFNVEAVDAKTEGILWRGDMNYVTKWDYDYEPATLAEEMSRDFAALLRKQIGGGR